MREPREKRERERGRERIGKTETRQTREHCEREMHESIKRASSEQHERGSMESIEKGRDWGGYIERESSERKRTRERKSLMKCIHERSRE